MFRETALQIEKTSAQMRETDLRFKETDRKIQEVSRQIGNLGGKWGQFVGNLVAPNCRKVFAERGIPVHEVHQRVKKRFDDGRNMEIDILVVNTDAVVLVEVKSTLTVRDIREHLDRLGWFKEFFPRYGDCRVMGAVAGMASEEGAEEFARNQGLFVLVQSGETMELANEARFQPRVW
ncbi:MAG: DUF3782 domain-containing protein [Magnetococcales bacterium]|nr:DUF3782 domain-containing protein [Magnetococcales bacterium]